MISRATLNTLNVSRFFSSLFSTEVRARNTQNTLISNLPPEMISYISSFLSVYDRLNFNQAMIDSGLANLVDLHLTKMEFNKLSLTEQLFLITDERYQGLDFKEFYDEASANKTSKPAQLYLYNIMCENFKQLQKINDEIAINANGLSNTLQESDELAVKAMELFDSCVDDKGFILNKFFSEVTALLFPHVRTTEAKTELGSRVRLFFIDHGHHSMTALNHIRNLLRFLNIAPDYRGMPFKYVAHQHRLDNTDFYKIMHTALDEIRSISTEEKRNLLLKINATEERAEAAEKIIAIIGRKLPFYSNKSPYSVMIREVLMDRLEKIPIRLLFEKEQKTDEYELFISQPHSLPEKTAANLMDGALKALMGPNDDVKDYFVWLALDWTEMNLTCTIS